MNFKTACHLLEIDSNDKNWRNVLKKQYKLKALKYHPDKNKEGKYNDDLFKEISAAYQYLENYDELTSFNEKPRTYLGSLIILCEHQATLILQELECENFVKIYNIIKKYKQFLHFSTTFYDFMEKRNIYWFSQGNLKKRHLSDIDGECIYNEDLLSSTKKYSTYYDSEWDLTYYCENEKKIVKDISDSQTMLLKPLLDDIITENVYKCVFKEATYLIPLWHHELVYENADEELIVKIIPKLPSSNYWIDEDNNLHQKVEYTLYELWDCVVEEKCMEIFFGKKRLLFYPNRLKLQTEQIWKWKNQGISMINSTNIYDISEKADIILHIHISGIT